MTIEKANPGERPRLEIFFDGECPLCRREIALVRKWDYHQKLCFVDISSSSFDALAYTGKSLDDLMREIHARFISAHSESNLQTESKWITGVDVFREIYSRVGFSAAVRMSRFWGIDTLLQWSYQVFAKVRYHFAIKRIVESKCDDSCKITSGVAENKVS